MGAADGALDDEHMNALPHDSDGNVDDLPTGMRERPVHLRPAYIGIVAIGGAVGTGVREALSLAIPNVGAFPLAILVINITGAFVLGLVLEVLRRLGPDEGRRRRLRLLIGTGVIGGYTTYSTFAVGTATAITGGHAWTGVLYALAGLVVGTAAGFGGVAAGARPHRSARTNAPAEDER